MNSANNILRKERVALVAKGSVMIGRKTLVDSLFDEEVQKKDGFILKKPKEWL